MKKVEKRQNRDQIAVALSRKKRGVVDQYTMHLRELAQTYDFFPILHTKHWNQA